MSTAEMPNTATQVATPPIPPPADPTPAPAAPPAGFAMLHEEDGGDGRIHVVAAGAPAGAACPCGVVVSPTASLIKADDPQLGFRPPEMFCDAARALLTSKATPAQNAAQTQAIAQQAQREAVPFAPRDTAEMFRYASFLARSRLIPRALQGSPSDILVVLLKGQDLGLTPLQSIAGINVIDGKAEVGALLMVGLVRKSGFCELWQLVHSDDKRAVYKTKRRGDDAPTVFEYTIEEAEAAGLTRKGGDAGKIARSPWNTQRRTMLRRRCQSMLCREVYPDIVGGLYDHEELSEVRELETELIRAGVKAAVAGFSADPAMDPPGWMQPAPVAASSNVDDKSPVAAVEVMPTPARKPPTDPLKDRLAKKAQAAKPAAPDTQPMPAAGEVSCTGCGVPIDPPQNGAPQMCYACQNS